MVSDKDLKKIAVVYSLTQALLCCNYIIFGFRSKYGNVRNYMLYFDIYFGTECFLNSCTGVILFSGMQKFRLPKEELAENPTCHSITKFVDDPLESLRLFIAWAIVAAVLCFCGSVALSMVLKWGSIPGNKLKDDPVLKMHDKLRDRSIFSSIVFYVIYAIFKALVLVVLCKFYCHHRRKVKDGQPLYTPYDHGAHREHHRVFAAPTHHEHAGAASTRHPVPSANVDNSITLSTPARVANSFLTQEGV
ncbi:uncharacterized protein LOC119441035 [Dermacentor silvarum]|uniref:uncharacterized protein LOC119441035 n=1 Tax=Dermacentor silvarum TaxID=543639 RepID=UPI002100A901|nr:uncharacterized protein LOC119441035 [Dermacentor silvarum]